MPGPKNTDAQDTLRITELRVAASRELGRAIDHAHRVGAISTIERDAIASILNQGKD